MVSSSLDGLNEMGVCYDDLNTDMFSLGNLILTPAGKNSVNKVRDWRKHLFETPRRAPFQSLFSECPVDHAINSAAKTVLERNRADMIGDQRAAEAISSLESGPICRMDGEDRIRSPFFF